MSEHAYFVVYDAANRTRVRILTDRGAVVDFVVQLETMLDDVFVPVVRYDGSHGRAHRDMLNWTGDTIDKQWLPEHWTMGQAVTYGIREIAANWPDYVSRFLEASR